nr:UDP-glucose 4-epimerase GalE [Zhihengliuella flava]
MVTGGAGYIGSHTVLVLLEAGHRVTVVDDFSGASAEALRRVEALAGRRVEVAVADVLDADALTRAVVAAAPDAVVHFAGLKAAGESVAEPERYYRVNVGGTLNVLDAMLAAGCSRLVFSSSASVYGRADSMPVSEEATLAPANPYGRTKAVCEAMLSDLAAAHPEFQVAILRYFNPVGAHPSGDLGESPAGEPSNLMPLIAAAAVGSRAAVKIHGGDYPTPDGTGIRDFIHVLDLAEGHLRALDAVAARAATSPGRAAIWNLGTGRGTSVLEVIRATAAVAGREIAYEIGPRRPGDVAVSYADCRKAATELGWRAQRGLDEMVRDTLAWQRKHPGGYTA